MIFLSLSVMALSVVCILHTMEIKTLRTQLKYHSEELDTVGRLSQSTSSFAIKTAEVLKDMCKTDASLLKAVDALGKVVFPEKPGNKPSSTPPPWI